MFFAFLSPLFADEASERRLGEEALSAGDYKSAAKFFDNARLIAGDDAERWGVNTLSMAEAKLRDGDVEEAKQLLAEYRSRFPARSAGMLPGLILMAEKRYGEAETFFASLASGASDPGVACAAELGIGEARLRQKNYKGALEKFEQIENENADLPQWVRRAHEARIFTLLESGNLTAAAVLLSSGKFRADDAEHWLCLDLLYLLRSRKFDQFYTGWGELRKKGWKNPAPVLYLLAADGARLALEMKQPEAAARLCAAPGSKECGAVSVAVQYYAEPRVLFQVSRGSFLPPPNVDSAVIRIDVQKRYADQTRDPQHFFSMLKHGFSQRRKTLVNALSATMHYEKPVLLEALHAMELPETVRMENLTMEQLVELSNRLSGATAEKV